MAKSVIVRHVSGDKIRELRKSMGISQADFARQVGVTWLTVSRWENGHMKASRLCRQRIYQIAQVVSAALAEKGRTEFDFRT